VRQSTGNLTLSGVILLLLAALFIGLATYDDLPPREELVAVEGRLEQVVPATSWKYGRPTRFRLSGDGRLMQYVSKAGRMGFVEDELQEVKQETVRVLVDPNDEFATVFEITIAGRPVRSYAEVADDWRGNNRFGLWVGVVSALAGLAFLLRARLR
jgi:hypothetical protein